MNKARGARAVRGFGFDPVLSPYHYAVNVEPGQDGKVTVEERFTCEDDAEVRAPTLKVVLDNYRWSRIAEQLRANFNKRLRTDGLPSGKWTSSGDTLLAAHLGKELTLLAWVVEDADPTLIPNIVANWLGLAPEERWWLYTTINATAGHPLHGRNRGWRKAIKIAFAENPADAQPSTGLHERVKLPLQAGLEEPNRELSSEHHTMRATPGRPGSDTAGDNDAKETAQRSLTSTPAKLKRNPRGTKARAQLSLLPEDDR
jgi:hypothetical protein